MTTPTPNHPLDAASVGLLREGDLLRSNARVHTVHRVWASGIALEYAEFTLREFEAARFTFLGRPDADGWIVGPPPEGLKVEHKSLSPAFWHPHVAPIATPAAKYAVEASGSERDGFTDALLSLFFKHGLKVALEVSDIEALRVAALRPQPSATPVSRPGDGVEGGGGYDRTDVRYGLHLIANEECDEVAASYYAKKALSHLAAFNPSAADGQHGWPYVIDHLEALDHNWIIARGQLSDDEPPYGCQILDGEDVIAEGECSTLSGAVSAALADLNGDTTPARAEALDEGAAELAAGLRGMARECMETMDEAQADVLIRSAVALEAAYRTPRVDEGAAGEPVAWRETFIVDEEDGPAVGVIIDLPDGSQIWTGECSAQLLDDAEAREESPESSGQYLIVAAKGEPTRVVAQVATVDDGIALARAIAGHAHPSPTPAETSAGQDDRVRVAVEALEKINNTTDRACSYSDLSARRAAYRVASEALAALANAAKGGAK